MAENYPRHRKRISRQLDILNSNSSRIVKTEYFSDFDDDEDNNNKNNNKAKRTQLQRSQQRSTVNLRRKSETLICCICGGPAHGYNFDAITCESCKAFFRRNALKSKGEFKCRMNDGKCVITMSTRKRCKACRLAKCLKQGMRADWILTDEERVNKRLKIEENRRLRRIIYPDSSDSDEVKVIKTKSKSHHEDDKFDDDVSDNLPLTQTKLRTRTQSFLTTTDFIRIQQIQQAYDDSVRLVSLTSDIPSYPCQVQITEASDMINFPANMQASRLITYYKLLPEFSSLNENDKVILVKYHIFPLIFIRSALNYDPLNDIYHEPNTNDCAFSGRDLIQCFSLDQYEKSTKCIKHLVDAAMDDRFILQVFLIVMLFSKGSSISTTINEMEPIARDMLAIFNKQNVFIDLLWKYCENKFGHSKTTKIWLNLTMSAMDAHMQAYKTRHKYVKINSVANNLSPLMRSVMLIV